MQDWAAAVSQNAWSKPLSDKHSAKQTSSNMVEPMEIGDDEIDASCWRIVERRTRSGYFKIKPH